MPSRVPSHPLVAATGEKVHGSLYDLTHTKVSRPPRMGTVRQLPDCCDEVQRSKRPSGSQYPHETLKIAISAHFRKQPAPDLRGYRFPKNIRKIKSLSVSQRLIGGAPIDLEAGLRKKRAEILENKVKMTALPLPTEQLRKGPSAKSG